MFETFANTERSTLKICPWVLLVNRTLVATNQIKINQSKMRGYGTLKKNQRWSAGLCFHYKSAPMGGGGDRGPFGGKFLTTGYLITLSGEDPLKKLSIVRDQWTRKISQTTSAQKQKNCEGGGKRADPKACSARSGLQGEGSRGLWEAMDRLLQHPPREGPLVMQNKRPPSEPLRKMWGIKGRANRLWLSKTNLISIRCSQRTTLQGHTSRASKSNYFGREAPGQLLNKNWNRSSPPHLPLTWNFRTKEKRDEQREKKLARAYK